MLPRALTLAPEHDRNDRTASRRDRIVGLLCWLGLLLPPAIVRPRSGPEIAEDPFTLLSLAKGGLPAVLLLAALILARPRLAPRDVREVWLGAYLAFAVASSLWSVAPVPTLLKAGSLVVAYGLLVLLVRTWRSPRQGLDQLATVVYALLLAGAAGAVLVPELAFDSFRRLHLVLPAVHAVPLGMVGAVGMISAAAGLGLSFLGRLPWRVGLFALSTAVMLLTQTRTAVGVAIVGLLALVAFSLGRRAAAVLLAALVAGVVLVAVSPLGQPLTERFVRGQSMAELASLNNRLPMWGDAVAAWESRPLTGLGYYSGHRFGPYAERFAERHPWMAEEMPTEGDEAAFAYIDGTWIETLLNLGLVGLLLLAGFTVAGAVHAWRYRATSGGSGRLALLAGVGVHSVLDFTIQSVGYPMVVLAVLLLLPGQEPDEDAAEPEG
jgi:O-antigen ligase